MLGRMRRNPSKVAMVTLAAGCEGLGMDAAHTALPQHAQGEGDRRHATEAGDLPEAANQETFATDVILKY